MPKLVAFVNDGARPSEASQALVSATKLCCGGVMLMMSGMAVMKMAMILMMVLMMMVAVLG